MKRLLLTSLLLGAIVNIASAEVSVTVTSLGEQPNDENSPRKIMKTADIIVKENFSEFNSGQTETPDYENIICEDGGFISENLTEIPGWSGNKVFSAGGACALQTFDAMNMAYIRTPLMDYSGSLNISFIARYLINKWEDEDGSTWRDTGSSVMVSLDNLSHKKFQLSEDDNILGSIRLYPDQGWCEISIEIDNFSAYNDSFIEFACPDCILIDDIKITASADNFIASPVISKVKDVTETSFTVEFEPVRKAFNYYMMLYTCEGYLENGDPKYIPVLDPETMEWLESFNVTVEEYLEIIGESPDSPYLYYDIVQAHEPKFFTYTDLNPEKDYYFAILSHYIYTFSTPDIHSLNILPTPIISEPSSIYEDNFTANWESVKKADGYIVNLYGINQAKEATDEFVVFEENFDKTSNFTSNTDLFDPLIVDELIDGTVMDDITTIPGWYYADEDLGFLAGLLDGMAMFPCEIQTPEFNCGYNDFIWVAINAVCTSDDYTFKLKFAGSVYTITSDDRYFNEVISIPTNGLEKGRLGIVGPPVIWDYFYIDELVIMQEVEKGALAYNRIEKHETSDCVFEFNETNKYPYDYLGYSVISYKGEGSDRIYSEESDIMIVDPEGNIFAGLIESGISDQFSGEIYETARYTIDGKSISNPVKGLNIVRYNDGSVKKVIIR